MPSRQIRPASTTRKTSSLEGLYKYNSISACQQFCPDRQTVAHLSKTGTLNEEAKSWPAHNMIRYVLKNLGVPCINSVGEHDQFVANYAREHNAYAVLAQVR